MTATPPWGVYVHVPWCRVRCPYCAFVVEPVGADPPPDTQGYTDAVLRQWSALVPLFPGRPATVAFGGGTPSLHPPDQLARWIQELAPSPGAEITLEANPEDVTPAWLDAILAAGVTRLSLGVQTLQLAPARLLARAHSARDARRVLALVARAGFQSWSFDLIFAVPGQTRGELDADLDAVGTSGVPHISLYGLAAEPGTPYTRALAAGRLRAPTSEAWREAYDHARSRLRGLGLDQYEVSNHARPGHRSRHNEHYWKLRPWAGLGVAAHGRLPDGRRTVGPQSLAAFRADPLAWEEWTLPSVLERAEELLLSCMRHVEGLDLSRLDALGYRLPEAAIAPLVADGLATLEGRRFALSASGLPLTDALIVHLATALEAHPG